MLAAGEGHLPVARLLVETYHCDVNEEDGKVSGWEEVVSTQLVLVPTCDQVTQEAGTQCTFLMFDCDCDLCLLKRL